MNEPELQIDFPDQDRADWHRLAEKGLRGSDFDTLISKTEDGLQRGPLFDAAQRPDAAQPLPRTDPPQLDGRAWHICAPIQDKDFAYANAQLLEDLSGGASAVRIMGAPFKRKADLKRLLEGVYLELVPVIFAPDQELTDLALRVEDLSDAHVTLGLNPKDKLPDLPDLWRAFTANAAAIHEAGGTDVMELAGFAATIADGFRRHGPKFHDHISVLLAVGTDAHLNIVKIRASRRIYATIAGYNGIDAPTLPVHAISSLRMMQSQDAWTNLLRTKSAGFGAVAGGADYITLRPFTDTPDHRRLGNPTSFGHRIARNQQILMMEESHLGHVQDVAYGSYFHERVTEDLSQAAWTKFQTIEAQGGIETYLSSGDFKADCDAAQTERERRDVPILGVTLHPDNGLKAPEVR